MHIQTTEYSRFVYWSLSIFKNKNIMVKSNYMKCPYQNLIIYYFRSSLFFWKLNTSNNLNQCHYEKHHIFPSCTLIHCASNPFICVIIDEITKAWVSVRRKDFYAKRNMWAILTPLYLNSFPKCS